MLEKTLDETSGIRQGDVDTLFYYIAYYNPLGNEVAFNFLSNRWDDIQTLVSKFSKQIQLINVEKTNGLFYRLGNNYCVDLFNYICYRLNTEADKAKVIHF